MSVIAAARPPCLLARGDDARESLEKPPVYKLKVVGVEIIMASGQENTRDALRWHARKTSRAAGPLEMRHVIVNVATRLP